MKTGRPEAVSRTAPSSSWVLRTGRVAIRLGPALRLEGATETGCGSPNLAVPRVTISVLSTRFSMETKIGARASGGGGAGGGVRRRLDLGSGNPAHRRGNGDDCHRPGQNRDSFPRHALTWIHIGWA